MPKKRGRKCWSTSKRYRSLRAMMRREFKMNPRMKFLTFERKVQYEYPLSKCTKREYQWYRHMCLRGKL